MKKLTNYTPGPRGVTMTDGDVVWIKPGQSIEVDADKVATTPDLGSKPKVEQDADDDAMKSALAEIADLKKEENASLKADIEKATKPAK